MFLFLILPFAFGDLLIIDKWGAIEKSTVNVVNDMIKSLLKASFPHKSFNDSKTNYLQIWNYKFIDVLPRTDFISATFNKNDSLNHFFINVPLGFHVYVQFEWLYNYFIFPVSGMCSFDLDIYNLVYDIILSLTSNRNIDAKVKVNFDIEKNFDVTVKSVFSAETIKGKLLKLLPSYISETMNISHSIFEKALSPMYDKMYKKSYELKTNYRAVYQDFKITSQLSKITTRNGLAVGYGNSVIISKNIPASKFVRRQYCIDAEYLTTIMNGPFSKLNTTFGKRHLPSDSLIPITVPGFSQLIPDIVNKYNRNDKAHVSINPAKENNKLVLNTVDDTHGNLIGAKFEIKLFVKDDNIISVNTTCNMIVIPVTFRIGNKFKLNVKVLSVSIDTLNVVSEYKTIIMSNVKEMAKEYIYDLFMSSFDYNFMGDGFDIEDEITPYAHPELMVADNALCLGLSVSQ